MLVWPSVLVFVIGAAALITGGIVGWVVLPNVIEESVIDNVKLSNGTEQFERWENLPFPVKFNVYLWEVLNPDEVTQGEKPKLKEKGPYVYNQYMRKEGIRREGDNLTYEWINSYQFDSVDSAPLTQDDEVTVLNVPFHAIIQIAYEMNPILVSTINAVANQIFGGQGVFLRTKVRDLLFDGVPICPQGRPSLQCRTIGAVPSPNMRKAEDGTIYFSLFNHKNESADGVFKIDSGETNVMELGNILEWKGSEHLNYWRNFDNDSVSFCNMLNGTDGNIYPPFVEGKESMYIFSTDICRSVTVHYVEKKKYMGITGLMYRAREDMLPGPSLDDTDCFCLNKTPGILQENGCLKKGALELYTCLQSHLVLTMPHFLNADQSYIDGIESGLKPNPEEHEIYILVEPFTGTPLSGKKRVQFNVFLRQIERMTATNNLTTTLFPVMWVDEGLNLGDDMVQLLYDQLVDPLKIVEAVRWTLVGVGIALVVAGAIWFIVAMKRKGETV